MKINSVIPNKHEMQHKFVNHDILEKCMINSLHNEDLDGEVLNENAKLTKTVLSLSERSNAKSSSNSEVKVHDVEKICKGLLLKYLPKHLQYVFVGEEKSKPLIIAVDLTLEKEKKVVEILIKHKEAIAWSVEDLKGINLYICMQKILMEENARTSIEHQRRLNQVMKEVVRKKVLK